LGYLQPVLQNLGRFSAYFIKFGGSAKSKQTFLVLPGIFYAGGSLGFTREFIHPGSAEPTNDPTGVSEVQTLTPMYSIESVYS